MELLLYVTSLSARLSYGALSEEFGSENAMLKLDKHLNCEMNEAESKSECTWDTLIDGLGWDSEEAKILDAAERLPDLFPPSLERCGPVPLRKLTDFRAVDNPNFDADVGDQQLRLAMDLSLRELWLDWKAPILWNYLWKPFLTFSGSETTRAWEAHVNSTWHEDEILLQSMPGPKGHAAAEAAVAPIRLPVGQRERECYFGDRLEGDDRVPLNPPKGHMKQILDRGGVRIGMPTSNVPFAFRYRSSAEEPSTPTATIEGDNATCIFAWGFDIELLNVLMPVVGKHFVTSAVEDDIAAEQDVLSGRDLSFVAYDIPDMHPPLSYTLQEIVARQLEEKGVEPLDPILQSFDALVKKMREVAEPDASPQTRAEARQMLVDLQDDLYNAKVLSESIEVDYLLQALYGGHVDGLMRAVEGSVGLAASTCPIYVSRFGSVVASPYIDDPKMIDVLDEFDEQEITEKNYEMLQKILLKAWDKEGINIGQEHVAPNEDHFQKARLWRFLNPANLIGGLKYGLIDAAIVPAHQLTEAMVECPKCKIVVSGLPLTVPSEVVLSVRNSPPPF